MKLSSRALIATSLWICLAPHALASQTPSTYVTPTVLIAPGNLPLFEDDLDFASLDLAINRQLQTFAADPRPALLKFGNETYTSQHLIQTLNAFLELAHGTQACIAKTSNRAECMDNFRKEVKEKYLVYAPKLASTDPHYGEADPTFFTSYYTPTLQATKSPTDQNIYAIYAKPTSDALRKSTRVEIDFDHKLAGSGSELFYTSNLFDLYLLQVQGAGKIVVGEGEKRQEFYIYYDGSNELSFKFIYHYMLDKGYITSGRIEVQRQFMQDHPALQREIYASCPGYVYFVIANTPPLGNSGVILTGERSIATDGKYYGYKGLLTFIEAQRPTEDSAAGNGPVEFKSFSRFFIDQDIGSAITGKARVDLYHGETHYAERAAYSTEHYGKIFFLMLK